MSGPRSIDADPTASGPGNSSPDKSTPKTAQRPEESIVSIYTRKAVYRFLRIVARIIYVLWFRIRVEGRYHVPLQGGGMLLSTHQSGMDPVLVGLACNRNLNFLARSTLFRNPAFSLLLRTLDSIPIDRERGGLKGLREMLSRLRSGELVLLFPEGTRTSDGAIGSLKPGFLPIARRSEVPLIPVTIVGAYECMPKGSKWLFPKPIAVVFGKPLLVDDYRDLSDEQIVDRIADSLSHQFQQGQQRIRGHY